MAFKTVLQPILLMLATACSSEEAAKNPNRPPLANPEPQSELSSDWKMNAGYVVLEWPDLAIPDFRPEFNAEIGEEVQIPIFREEIKPLNGQMIEISGFFFPFEDDPQNPYYVLSQNPWSQCFFCGAAGPESVMDLLMKQKPGKLKMDDKVTFRGRLKLNDADVMYLNYMLEDAERVKNP
jgi:hypothetical protein